MTNPDEVDAAVEAAGEFGGANAMVNDAGVFRQHDTLDVTEAAFDRITAVNVKGAFFGAQAAARRMVDGDGGSVVNLSSVAGLRGTGTYVPYCASKGAVRPTTDALADEFGPEGVRVTPSTPASSRPG